MTQSVIKNRIENMRLLVQKLKKYFTYVSVLGCDVQSQAVRADKRVTTFNEQPETDRGFVIRMYGGDCVYEYALTDIPEVTDALAEEIAQKVKLPASAAAKVIPPVALADEPLKRDFERDSDVDEVTTQQLIGTAVDLKQRVLERDNRIVNAACIFRIMRVSKVFVSENRTLTQSYAYVNGYLLAIMKEDGKLVSARECVDGPSFKPVAAALPGKVDKLIDKAKHLLKAKPIVPGEYDVITDPSITGLIAHEAFGHGVEMDQFVKERALAMQYMGEAVASPLCNMRDGAGAALSVASYFFDDDGVLAGDTQIIKDGILVGGLCDAVSAAQLNVAPTGNGRRESHKNKAYSRMTNTFFEKGGSSLKDMIASIKLGYMLFETNNGMEDPKNWAIQCTAEYGIEIVDGVLTENYVAPVVMSGYVPDLLKSISMVSGDMEIEGSGMCGKGYKEWVRVSDGGPCLKARIKLG